MKQSTALKLDCFAALAMTSVGEPGLRTKERCLNTATADFIDAIDPICGRLRDA